MQNTNLVFSPRMYLLRTKSDYLRWVTTFATHQERARKQISNEYVSKRRAQCFETLCQELQKHYNNNEKCYVVKYEGRFYCPYEIHSI
ncbi:Integrase catalytic region [Entamoeba marina]